MTDKVTCYLCRGEKNLQFCNTCGTFYCRGETPSCWGKHMRIAVVHVQTKLDAIK